VGINPPDLGGGNKNERKGGEKRMDLFTMTLSTVIYIGIIVIVICAIIGAALKLLKGH